MQKHGSDSPSLSETYKRNAFNNGFVVFECPKLVDHLTQKFKSVTDATIAASEIKLDYQRSKLTCDGKEFAFPPLSPVAQELVVAGGAAAVVAQRLKKQE